MHCILIEAIGILQVLFDSLSHLDITVSSAK